MENNNETNETLKDETSNQNFKKKKIISWVIVSLAFILILLAIVVNSKTYKLFTYKNTFKQEVENNVLNNLIYKINSSFEGKFCNKLTITMKDSFNELNYDEQKTIILDTSKKIREFYEDYYIKIRQATILDDNIKAEDITCSILFYVNEDYYEYTRFSEFLKNGKFYELEHYLREKILAKFSITPDNEIYSHLEFLDDTEVLQNILLLENLEDANMEILYQVACKKMNTDDYTISQELFKKLSNYKDSSTLLGDLNNRLMIDGEWRGTAKVKSEWISNYSYDTTHHWIIKGNACYNIFSSETAYYDYNTYYCLFKDNILYVFYSESAKEDLEKALYKMKYENGTLTYAIDSTNNMVLKKESDNTVLRAKSFIEEPRIGMTKSEAEKSTWGKPKKINKTTTAYGTHEQWVYSGYRYLYFDNGKLTSIQE